MSTSISYADLYTVKNNTKNNVFIVYVGEPDSTGESWCSDCRIGVPILKAAILKYNCDLYVVSVGSKVEWKKPDNVFRSEVSAIPTLLHVKSKKTLIEDMSTVDLFIKSSLDQ